MNIRVFILSVVFFALAFNGCKSTAIQPEYVSGVVAEGAPLQAEVTLVDAEGVSVSTSTNVNGSYMLEVTLMTPPFMLKAVAKDRTTLYSYAAQSGLANVTPITTYILHQAALDENIPGGVSQLFNRFNWNSDIRSSVDLEMSNFDVYVASLLNSADLAGFNHFNSGFNADHTGYDAILDAMDIEIDRDTLVIRINGALLHTVSYLVEEGELNVTGQVRNPIDDTPIDTAGLVFHNGNASYAASTDINGEYNATVPNFRMYDVNITKAGYRSVNYYDLSSFALNTVGAEVIPLIPASVADNGFASGHVIDARTSSTPIAGATASFRAGINNLDGEVVGITETDSAGSFQINIPTGVYTVELSKDGYTTAYTTVVTYPGNTTVTELSLVYNSFGTTNAFATIVLNWSENPNDLDSHLTGPNNGSRFHIAYYDKQVTTTGSYVEPSDPEDPCSDPAIIANLDRDDVTSYGPETTTICQVEEGIYKFYVHHYAGTSTISDSPAQVTVTSNGLSRTFVAPAGARGDDDVWHVFNIDSYGNVEPINIFLPVGTDYTTVNAPALNALETSEPEEFLYLPVK